MNWAALGHLPDLFSHRRIIHLTLFVTRRCNSRCPFCFYRRDATLAQEEIDAPEFDLGEYLLLSRQLGRLFWLAFSGGEICLRDDLAAIVHGFYRRNRPAFILLPTNGLMPERIEEVAAEVATNCPRSTVTVKLSLDGSAHLHNRLRGVAGAYERVVESCRRLRRLRQRHPNLEVGFNTVLMRDTLPEIEQTMDLVRAVAPDLPHTLSLFRGNVSGGKGFAVSVQDYRRVAARFEEQQGTRGNRYRFSGGRLKAALDQIVHQRILAAMGKGKRTKKCRAGRLSLTVRENGGVYPCEDFSLGLGNLRQYDHDLTRVLASPGARQVLRAIDERRCSCTHECYHMLNSLSDPLTAPELLWRALLKDGRSPSLVGKDGGLPRSRTMNTVPDTRL